MRDLGHSNLKCLPEAKLLLRSPRHTSKDCSLALLPGDVNSYLIVASNVQIKARG